MSVISCLGIMSGTSLDGLDLAVLKTDGGCVVEPITSTAYKFPAGLVKDLLSVQGNTDRNLEIIKIEKTYTDFVISCVQDFAPEVDYIGWHGQTIGHAPEHKKTLQLGDGEALAKASKIPVVYDFRQADVLAGGQGAPFAPVYHQAIARHLKLAEPCIFINIGGVANITYCHNDALIAFDVGAGNALMDDVMRQEGKTYDENGALACKGKCNDSFIKTWLEDSYFAKPYPKSLHREEFHKFLPSLESYSLEDKLSTLNEFTVQGIIKSLILLPQEPQEIILCGGGRHNQFLCDRLQSNTPTKITTIDSYGFNGDMLEAEAFAYLAVRHLRGLPLSYPTTTGVPSATCGGVLANP